MDVMALAVDLAQYTWDSLVSYAETPVGAAKLAEILGDLSGEPTLSNPLDLSSRETEPVTETTTGPKVYKHASTSS